MQECLDQSDDCQQQDPGEPVDCQIAVVDCYENLDPYDPFAEVYCEDLAASCAPEEPAQGDDPGGQEPGQDQM